MKKKIGFVGAGQMASALASGFVRAGEISGEDISAFDPNKVNAQNFCQQVAGTQIKSSNEDVVGSSDIVFIATKPQIISAIYDDIQGKFTDQLIISIVAGIQIESLQAGFQSQNIVRVMPNTPCLIGKGALGFSAGSAVAEPDRKLVKTLLETVGICYEVAESQLNPLTALSGSGPAYVFEIIEALSDGAVRMGLPREMSTRLAAQTLFGAAAMVLETGEHPGALKDKVTSPGGTTIAGLYELQQGAVRGALMSAIEAATLKSIELGEQ